MKVSVRLEFIAQRFGDNLLCLVAYPDNVMSQAEIKAVGDEVRQLKAANADKSTVSEKVRGKGTGR